MKSLTASTEDIAAFLKTIGEHIDSNPITLPVDAGYLARLLTDNFQIMFAEDSDV